MKYKNAWIAALIIACVTILASCSTTRKNKNSYRQTTDITTEEKKGIDTTATSKTDLQQQSTAQTTTGSTEESEVQKEFNIDFYFGNGTAEDYTGLTTGKIVKPVDTLLNKILVRTTGPGTVKLNADGSIEATGNIKNARYNETGRSKKQDTTTTTLNTNTQLQVIDEKKGIDTGQRKTTEKTEIIVKNKEVSRTSYWRWLWLLLIPAVWLGGWWLGLWPLIPKRKKRDEYPVKYTNYQPPKPPVK